MAIDTTLIRTDNLIATGPTPTNTVRPSKVTQIGTSSIWEYEFPSAWPEAGAWTVTIDTDTLSLPRGTVVRTFTVTPSTTYVISINWETGEKVETIASRVTATEGKITTLEGKVATLETNKTAVDRSISGLTTSITQLNNAATPALQTVAVHTTQIDDLRQRIVALETAAQTP